jgi:hypothetical protein
MRDIFGKRCEVVDGKRKEGRPEFKGSSLTAAP